MTDWTSLTYVVVDVEGNGQQPPHNRFQLRPGSAHAEIYFYKQATERLIQAGFDVLRVNCNQQAAHHVAAHILDRLTVFFARPKGQA